MFVRLILWGVVKFGHQGKSPGTALLHLIVVSTYDEYGQCIILFESREQGIFRH